MAGRFQLNAQLPIPFDGWGNMEVDLLCQQAGIAVEIDGGQHFSDAEAYRRDRRKDQLLQEHGYFVLRFLAEDVGKSARYGVGRDPADAGASGHTSPTRQRGLD